MPKPKKINFLRQFVEIMIVLFFSLLIVEVFVRIYLNYHLVYDVEMSRYSMNIMHDKNYHVCKPNTSIKVMGVWIRTNSDGFRGKDYPIGRTYKKRIIFLGNSFLLGWGVKEQDTFPDILERDLSKIYPTEIINTGTIYNNTEQEMHLFIEKGLRYHPDKVVLFWGGNDIMATPHRSKWGFLGYSELMTLCWSFSHILAEHVDPAKSYQSYYLNLYRDLSGIARAKEAVLLLKNICKKNNIILQVVMLPELHNLVNYPFKKEYRMFEDFFKNNGIDVLDLTPFFSSWKNPEDLWCLWMMLILIS